MAYIGNTPTIQAFPFDQFSGTGAQTAFTLTQNTAGSSSVLVCVNGVKQNPNTYSIINLTLTFSEAPPAGTNNIEVLYLGMPSTAVTTPGNTAFMQQTEFTVPSPGGYFDIAVPTYTPGMIVVYRNGVKLALVDFTATNGTTVNVGGQINDIITVQTFTLSSLVDALPVTGGVVTGATTFQDNLTVNKSITFGSNGAYVAGSIYSDGNWGILMRAKTNAYAAAFSVHGWDDTVELFRYDASGGYYSGATTMVTGYNSKMMVAYDGGGQQHGLTLKSKTDSTTAINFLNASNGVSGRITVSATTATYNTSSDYRLKENIQPMKWALSDVMAMKPCTYTWKQTGEFGQGFIAHELQAVAPLAVSGEKDAVHDDGTMNPQAIDPSKLVATLVAAIQEQQKIIDDLRERVIVLERK